MIKLASFANMPYIFGYGSLLNEECTEDYTYVTYASLNPSEAFSVRRSYNVHCEWCDDSLSEQIRMFYTALGIEYVPYNDARPVNGLILRVSDAKMNELIQREQDYLPVQVPLAHFSCTQEAVSVDGPILVFVPMFSVSPAPEYPLNTNYLEICIDGFMKQGHEYARLFLETTAYITDEMKEYGMRYILGKGGQLGT
jgi:hypothetical protein